MITKENNKLKYATFLHNRRIENNKLKNEKIKKITIENKFLHIFYRSHYKPFEEYEEIYLNINQIISIKYNPMGGYVLKMSDNQEYELSHGLHYFNEDELLDFIVSNEMLIESYDFDKI